MVARIAAAGVTVIVLLYLLISGAGNFAWWLFSSGPLTQDPEIVLGQESEVGAVRVHGEHPELDDPDAARRTVDDLDTAGGFERAVLLVALPTGSGWVDPTQVEATERWADGDVATVSMRYSTAPSAAVFALRPEIASESAHALLSEVTDRIREFPAENRPALVVHGQSLGAQAGVEALADAEISSMVDAVVWQGLPGTSPAPAPESTDAESTESCTVSVVNPDDPVAELSWSLARNPLQAVRVLASLPGSESKSPGSGHSYRPVVPPAGCVGLPEVADDPARVTEVAHR